MMPRDLIIATRNIGKFREIKEQIADVFENFHSLLDFPETIKVHEDGALYLDNAWKKARKIGDRFGIDTLADDSGLEVDALGGRPGLYSARYGKSDSERVSRLLEELAGVPAGKRAAVFKAYLAFYMPLQEKGYIFYGSLKGFIGFERRGEHGFGYDPIFCVTESGKCLAELTTEEKNRISHRGRALAAFRRFLKGLT